MADKPSILVVDDEETIRELLRDALEAKGFKVIAVPTGNEALEEAKKTPYTCVFLDIIMPGLNGLETFLALKKIDPKINVVLMTAYSVEELVKEALEKGAITCLYKPFKLKEIFDLLEKIIEDTKKYC
jgi:DNA-binding NtrC family response regulator